MEKHLPLYEAIVGSDLDSWLGGLRPNCQEKTHSVQVRMATTAQPEPVASRLSGAKGIYS